jgi:hypothetical protein
MKSILTNEELKNKWFWHFIEAGFIAVNQSDQESALKLLHAAELIAPEGNYFAKIGFGYLHFMKLEIAQACEHFKFVLDKHPENDLARSLLGLTIAMGRHEGSVDAGEKILKEVLHHSSSNPEEKDVNDLAKTSIHFIDQFLKKKPGPATIQKK